MLARRLLCQFLGLGSIAFTNYTSVLTSLFALLWSRCRVEMLIVLITNLLRLETFIMRVTEISDSCLS